MLAGEDSPIIYNSLFFFPANIKDGEEKEVTFYHIKDNLDNYFARKMKRLSSFLIDSACQLIDEKITLEEKVQNQEIEVIALTLKNLKTEELFAEIRS